MDRRLSEGRSEGDVLSKVRQAGYLRVAPRHWVGRFLIGEGMVFMAVEMTKQYSSVSSTAVAARRAIALGLAAVLIAGPVLASDPVGDHSLAAAQTVLSILRLKGSPKVETAAAPGGDILVAPVGYFFTGVLLNTVKNNDYIIPIGGSIPAGTPIFGIPMSKATGVAPYPNLMWCAAMGGPTANQPSARWKIICLPSLYKSVRWIDTGTDLFPDRLAIPLNGMPATTPQIEVKSVDLAIPLTAAVQFVGWSGDGANVRLGVRQPDTHTIIGIHVSGDHQVATLHLGGAPDGASHLAIFGGEVAIRPGRDGKSAAIQVTRPFPVATAAQRVDQ